MKIITRSLDKAQAAGGKSSTGAGILRVSYEQWDEILQPPCGLLGQLLTIPPSPRSQAAPVEMCVSGHEQYFPAHLIKYLPWLFIAH